MSEVVFCYCGRVAEQGKTCPKHTGKEAPKPHFKQKRYSGYSKAWELNHGAEGVRDD